MDDMRINDNRNCIKLSGNDYKDEGCSNDNRIICEVEYESEYFARFEGQNALEQKVKINLCQISHKRHTAQVYQILNIKLSSSNKTI